MFGRRTVVPWLMDKEKRLPEAPPLQRCHLCGSSSPAVRCEKCSNLIFCMSCDDMYHRHPKRRDHTRKAVNAVVTTPPPLPPPRPPSKNADPNKVPVPPPRRRKSQRSIPNSPLFGRKAAEQKPELPKKQFPNLKFGSLKRFIPGANSGRPPMLSPKEQYQSGMSHPDYSKNSGELLIDAKYGVGSGRQQENHCERQDRQPMTNYPCDRSLPRFPTGSNVADQSSSDAEEDLPVHCSMSRGSGSFVGSGPRDEQWSPISTGPPLPPPYSGMASRSVAALNHLGSYPDPSCGNSTLNRRNTMMSGTFDRSAGYGYPRMNFMHHSSSVCDLSNSMIPPPYMMGYRLPQVQSMADLQQGEMGPMAAPCGCRPNWIGPDAFGQWHPPVSCLAHSTNASTFASGMKAQQPTFQQNYPAEGMFSALGHPLMYPVMAPSNSPMGYSSPNSFPPSDPQGSQSTSNNNEQRVASPPASTTSKGSRQKTKEAIGHPRTSSRRPRPPLGTTSSEEDYYSAGASDEDEPQRNTVEERRNKNARHNIANNGSWECEHCTFVNRPDTRICNVCCKTTGRVKGAQVGVARKSSRRGVSKEVEVEEFEVDGEQDSANPPTRIEEKVIKFNRKNLPKEDDGEYEDLDSGQMNRAKSGNEQQFTEDIKGEQRIAPTKSSKQNTNGGPSSNTIRHGVEVATDPMESEDSLTVKCVQSDTQTYSSVFRDKILPASNSLSKTNGSVTGQKNVMSKGTSPPPQSISTQTPHADVWTSPEHPKSSLGRASSRMSLAGDTSELIGGGGYHPTSSVLKRATSLHFPRSYGGNGDGGATWGIGYHSGSMVRSGSRSSLMSDQHFGYNLSSGPPSRDASPPPPVQRNIISRRESNIERGQIMYPNFSRTIDHEDRNIRNESRKDYYLSLEELVEKRRQETLRSQGLELVKLLREAEQQNFSADDLQVALNHCGSQNPVQWLQDNWKNMVDTVVTLATNYGNDKKKNDIGVISSTEAKESLRLHKGNIWAAVTECVEQRQKRFAELLAKGNFSRDEVVAALTSNQGNVELAYDDLNKASLKPFLMRIWGPPSGVENQSGVTWDAMQALHKAKNFNPVKLDAWKDPLSLNDYNPISNLPSNNYDEDNINMDTTASDFNKVDSSLEDVLDSVADCDLLDNYAAISEGAAEKWDGKDEEFFDAVPGTPSEEQYEMENTLDLRESQLGMPSEYKEENAPCLALKDPISQQLSFPVTLGQSSVRLTSSATITLGQPRAPFPEVEATLNAAESTSTVTSVVQRDLEPSLNRCQSMVAPSPMQVLLSNDNVDDTEAVLLQISSNEAELQSIDEAPIVITELDKIEQLTPSNIIPQLDPGQAESDDLIRNAPRILSAQDNLCPKSPLQEFNSVPISVISNVLNTVHTALSTESDIPNQEESAMASTKDHTALGTEYIASTSMQLPVDQIAGESTNSPHKKEATTASTKVAENSTPRNDNRKVKQTPIVSESERRVRQYLAEGKLPTYEKAEVAIKLIDLRFDESEAIYAARECSDLYMAVSYLQQDCELCTGKFPMGKMISMLNCIHRCCHNCAKDYFTLKIKERNIMEAVCPFCNEPNLNDEEIAVDYFNNLDIVLKNLVDLEIHELFQRKLRDRALMSDPNFHWCHKCASGFIAEPNRRRLVCPDCKVITCAECKKPWEKQHDGISCQKFTEWKQDNDPEYQLVGLEKYLAENGIDCPKCKFRYALAKGGCMHFTCSQCKFEFCSGCGRPFRMAKKCGVSERCERLGLHAHHPRNCLFYLRDKEPKDLLKLLDEHSISYHIDIQCAEEEDGRLRKCPVMEQKELPDGVEDSKCGREVKAEYPGLCRLHYVEYLVSLINNNALDPVTIMDIGGLQQELKRKDKLCPDKEEKEQDEQYHNKLVQLILQEIPLEDA